MIPISDFHAGRGRKEKPVVVWVLIGLCVAIWLFQFTLPTRPGTGQYISSFDKFAYEYGAVPDEVIGKDLPAGFPVAPIMPILTLITSIFLHGGWSHMIFNMLYLWVFGDNIENRFGHFGFLMFYLTGGVVANLVHIALSLGSKSSIVPVIGASGAIAAVMGAYLALFPLAKIRTLVIFYLITFISIPAYWYLLIWFGMQFFGLLGSGSGVAWWAHIGGFIYGYLIAFIYLKIKYPHMPPPWTVFFKKRRGGNLSLFKRFGKSRITGGFRNYNNIEDSKDKKSDDTYDIWRR
jgi:rhomboid family protein